MKKILQKLLPKLVSLKKTHVNSELKSNSSSFSFFYCNPVIEDNSFIHTQVLPKEKANDYLYEKILTGKPFMASRFGNIDLWLCCNHLYNAINNQTKYDENLANKMYELNAIWPNEDKYLSSFCDQFFSSMKQIDYLGFWNNRGENILSNYFFEKATLGPLISYESFFYSKPWTSALSNKRVLVIHPYATSIETQYKNKEKLFSNLDVLPDFYLITYKPFNIIMDDVSRFSNWHEALEFMKSEIKNIEFDIALIGAGHFGLPLAAYIKFLGKQAVHIGGALQLLFGIKGRRWENREQSKYFNDNWIYPSVIETPSESIRMRVDGGDYWK